MQQWGEATDRFLEDLRTRGRTRGTLVGYRSHLRSLEEWADVDDPWAVSSSDVRGWLDQRGRSERASWRVARRFYAWSVEQGYLASSPVPDHIAEDVRQVRRALEDESEAYRRWVGPLDRYTARLRASGARESTVALHMAKLRQFARLNPDPWAVTTDDVAAWLATSSWAPETRKSSRNVLRRFYDEIPAPSGAVSPVSGIGAPRVPRRLPRPAARDSLEVALAEASERVRLMLLLGAYAGLRPGEVARVRPSTDVEDGCLYVHGKAGDQRLVPLHRRLVAALADEVGRRRAGGFGASFWPHERPYPGRPADAYLFPNGAGGHVTPGHVSVLVSRALPDGTTAHMLRHRFATDAYRSSRDLRAVQELLGHTTPRTTAVYTLTTDADLRAAVNGMR